MIRKYIAMAICEVHGAVGLERELKGLDLEQDTCAACLPI